MIERPRLLDVLGQGRDKRLTVIKAPAGFGKTSLCIAWLDRLRADGARVAWLSVDREDDEPAHFLSHLAQSLYGACVAEGAPPGLAGEVSLLVPRAVIATLVNALAEIDDELFLFVDDYHLIGTESIHEAVALLLAHAPSNFHLVLGTRADPPLPLARLRAGNALLEIDASMLRFSADETGRFVQRECAGGLPQASVDALHASTEGWAAALRLSAPMLARSQSGTWVAPSGTARPIAAYLEEMLACQTPELVDFMVRTAILDRLSAPLCIAVTGAADSQNMLQALATRQLLLDPLDVEGRWFRYHQLLRDYLRQRLETAADIDIADLHRRASRWYAAQALWTDAVWHALEAGDAADAVALIGQCAMSLVRQGDLKTLLGWQRRLPPDIMRGQVDVRLALARGMALAMRFEEASAMVEAIERDAAQGPEADRERYLWECRAIRALLAALRDDAQGALRLAEDCLSRPLSDDPWMINVLSNVVRFAHWKSGDLERLYATPWIPYSPDENRRYPLSSVYRLCLLGLAELQQMRFDVAERYFLQAMRFAEDNAGPASTAAALCAPALAQLRYEQDRLEDAETLLVERMPVIDAAVLLDSVLVAYTLLVRIAAARGHLDQAHAWVEQALTIGHQRAWHRLVAAILLERVRLLLAEGRAREAAACVEQIDRLVNTVDAPDCEACVSELDRYRTLGAASLAMAGARPDEAVRLLDALLRRLPQRHPNYLALRARTLLALACQASGAAARAVEECSRVLASIESARAYRIILDQGPGVGALLALVRQATVAANGGAQRLACIDELLERCNERYQMRQKASSASVREALSAREGGILALIAAGQSNKEIARTLGIAPETVKTHIKSIFVKLSVEKRAHAVARAQSLGLVTGH
ncbi:LuxR C-terminal-related transcriptional regulator [Cupriavidus sp. U2]|uniref:LuxR C-terminal-related transcriptional regulator n=1 Tax=Cupriavidus sp. U2 TaxID=2920269 RepID=UPI001E4BB313|nr:LuxR C-terminal-related transcriptional regulator [Cupriavidus sp. U2]